MQTTSWFDYIRADSSTRLALDRRSAAHREQMAALRAQQQALYDLAVIGVEQVKGLATVASGVEGVREDLQALNALFDWRLEQVLRQFQVQTERLDDIASVLRRPLDTQAQELWDRAQFAASRGWVDEAVQTYTEALAKNPFLYPAHLQLGFIHAYQRFEFTDAAQSFTLAARYAEQDDPTSAGIAHFQLHKFARESNDHSQAWTHIERACQLNSTLAPAWWDRATLAYETGRNDEIIPSLANAIKADPLYWHRAKEESWGSQQANVDSVLNKLEKQVQEASAQAIAGLDRWTSQVSQAMSNLRATDRSQFSAIVEPVASRLPELKTSSADSKYALVAAAQQTAQTLHHNATSRSRSIANAARQKIEEELAELRSQRAELEKQRTSARSTAEEEGKNAGWGAGGAGCATLIVAVVLFYIVVAPSRGAGPTWIIWVVLTIAAGWGIFAFVSANAKGEVERRVRESEYTYGEPLGKNMATANTLNRQLEAVRQISTVSRSA